MKTAIYIRVSTEDQAKAPADLLPKDLRMQI